MRFPGALGAALILLAGASAPAGAQPAFRVKDINPGTADSLPGSRWVSGYCE